MIWMSSVTVINFLYQFTFKNILLIYSLNAGKKYGLKKDGLKNVSV